MNHPQTPNDERERAKQIIEFTATHLFLTGKAGTGKTTFLKQLQQEANKRMIVLAPTGIAAINAGGSTIHSFFQLPFAPFIPNDKYQKMDFKLRKQKIKLIRSLDLIVIDEISMVRADLLDQIDAVLRQYRNHYEPFGGVQLLMIGDLQQLAPVAKDDEWSLLSKYYDSPYFFSSHALQQTHYVTIELKTVYRQSDPVFLELLNKIRTNQADAKVLAQLNQRYIPNFKPQNGERYIRLVTHNWQAQQINERELENIKEPTYTFAAKVNGTFPEYSYPTDAQLHLKLGAQVMFVKNDTEKRYYNGTLGEIVNINPNSCIVRTLDNDTEVKLEQEEWQNTRYALNEQTQEIQEKVEGSFHQYPIKLAWAITIHKSQGLTFERAIIDAHSSFAHGQTYVALSRCKTLEGMVLSSPIPASAIIQDKAVCKFNAQVEEQAPNANTIHLLQNEHCLKVISNLFDFSPIHYNLNSLIRLMEVHFSQLYPETLKRYQDILNSFNDQVITVAEKFRAQYQRLATVNPGNNISPELQERLQKGAKYFHEAMSPVMIIAQEAMLPTDNKEVKKRVNDILTDFQQNVTQKCQLLNYVAVSGFDIANYQRCRTLVSTGEKITPEGKIDLEAQAERKNAETVSSKEKLTIPSEIQQPELYKTLLKWKNRKAQEEGVPAFMILQVKALHGIANLMPTDAHTLSLIPYFGAKSLEKYGKEILEMVTEYVRKKGVSVPQPELFQAHDIPANHNNPVPHDIPATHDIPVPHNTRKATPPKEKKESSANISLRLYQQTKNVKAVAAERGLALSTIYGHLIQCMQEEKLAVEDFMPENKIKAIKAYIESQPNPKALLLSDIRNALGEQYEYNEIKAVLATYLK